MEQTILIALRVAALQYATDAIKCRDVPSIATQFTAQAREASKLADQIEAAGLAVLVYRDCPVPA